MRWHGRRVAVYAYGMPTDMRQGFDGLAALVTQAFHRDPLSGEVFSFLRRDRVRADPAQLELALRQQLEQARAQVLAREVRPPAAEAPRPARPGHGPRAQPALPSVDIRHELAPDQRACPACGGDVTAMVGQYETSARVTTVKLTDHLEHHRRQKYRCACNGAVVTAPGPVQLLPGSRYAPEFAVGVAVAKYADHLPLERQVRMMAREGLVVESQTLWDQLNALARHLDPTYEAIGRRALAAPVINVDETRWAIMGSATPAAGTVWTVRTPTESCYRILPGTSAEEGRKVLGGYRGTVVADGFAVYDVLARDGPGFTLVHCWAHAKRKYGDIADQWPVACGEISALIGERYAIERSVPGPFPGNAEAQTVRRQLRHGRSPPVLDRIWHWATVQVGLPRRDVGKAVRDMLERWDGLTHCIQDPRIPLDDRRRCPRPSAARARRRAGHTRHCHVAGGPPAERLISGRQIPAVADTDNGPRRGLTEVHRRGTRHEVDEDVGVCVRLHPDRQFVGEVAHRLLWAITEQEVWVVPKVTG